MTGPVKMSKFFGFVRYSIIQCLNLLKICLYNNSTTLFLIFWKMILIPSINFFDYFSSDAYGAGGADAPTGGGYGTL